MKLSILCLVVLPAAVLSANSGSSSELLAEIKGHPDGNAAFNMMSKLMTAAQQKMGLVQRHHGKVVAKVRKQADSLLGEEAQAYGDALGSYSAKLLKAEAELQSSANEAKAGLEASKASPSGPNAWNDPQVMERAKLNAQVAGTDRAVKKAERVRKSEIREAEERSEESLESEGQKLGMKLGDMTPIVDKAKKTLEALVEKSSAVPLATKASTASSPKKATLASLEDELAKATPKERALAAAAEKALDGFLSKTDKDISAKRAKIEDGLEEAQHEELSKFVGVTAKPVVKAHRSKKVHKSTTVVKAKSTNAPAAKLVKAKPASSVKLATKQQKASVKAVEETDDCDMKCEMAKVSGVKAKAVPVSKPASVVAKAAGKAVVPAKVASSKKAEPAPKAVMAKTPPAVKVAAVVAKKAALVEQDPCAGCTTGLAQSYQACASKHGNPCAETNAAGIVGSGPGQKKDVGCCMKKEKHDRCVSCSSMDCAHGTCNVNKKYYNTYAMKEKFDDKKAMKNACWGK